jgi:uridine kinase
VILIGGNTRTGKSTLATYLHIGFQKAELRALQVGLDNWLLPADQRSEDMGVYDRFQLPVVTGDLQKLIEGRTLRVTSYVNHPERKSAILEYNPDKMDIIIIDGVVALSSPVIRLMAHLKIFMTLSQDEFLKRIEDYYHWRGASDNEIKHLVHKRQKDEYQIIEKESNLADLIIKPSSR